MLQIKYLIYFLLITLLLTACGEKKDIIEQREIKYDNGQLREKGTIRIDLDGRSIKEGEWTYWYEDGQMKKKCSYINGMLTNKYQTWYKNGQKHEEGNYQNNEKHGKWSIWNKYGFIEEEIEYSKGKKDGQYTSWRKNGIKASEGLYVNDQRNGRWVNWYENAQKQDEGSYVNDRKNGKWYRWDEHGKLIETVHYDKGRIGSARSYDSEKQINVNQNKFR